MLKYFLTEVHSDMLIIISFVVCFVIFLGTERDVTTIIMSKFLFILNLFWFLFTHYSRKPQFMYPHI